MTTRKPAIHLSSNWRECEKMLAKWEKWEVYRWQFVNRLVNHFSHLTFHHSRRAIGIFTKHQRECMASFSSSFLQNQRCMKSAILWEVYSDWFAISQNSARTCRNARNDKCIASYRTHSFDTSRVSVELGLSISLQLALWFVPLPQLDFSPCSCSPVCTVGLYLANLSKERSR